MLWSVAPDGTFTLHGFGPYTDGAPQNVWHATAVATGPDGISHILWNNTDGRVMLWTVDDSGNFTLAGYGPYTDNAPQNKWSATAVSVGPDNVVHLLWSNTDHRAMLWNVAQDFTFTLAGYGPYTDNAPQNLWTATALATGPDNVSRILWNNTDDRVMLWDVNTRRSTSRWRATGRTRTARPQNKWSAVGVSVGSRQRDAPPVEQHGPPGDVLERGQRLRLHAGGLRARTRTTRRRTCGAATALATGPDGLSHILWGNTDYRAMLWGVDNARSTSPWRGTGRTRTTPPQNLWSATAVSAGP